MSFSFPDFQNWLGMENISIHSWFTSYYIYIYIHTSTYVYLIFSINLVSQVTLRSSGTDILYGCHLLRSSGTDILYGCHLLRRLFNILYFLWLYNEFFIILYNILKIAELGCCQIIILNIYVPSIHAYAHVLCLSLDLPYETR